MYYWVFIYIYKCAMKQYKVFSDDKKQYVMELKENQYKAGGGEGRGGTYFHKV